MSGGKSTYKGPGSSAWSAGRATDERKQLLLLVRGQGELTSELAGRGFKVQRTWLSEDIQALSRLSIEAEAAQDHVFSGWKISPKTAHSQEELESPSLSLLMDDDYQVIADFSSIEIEGEPGRLVSSSYATGLAERFKKRSKVS